MTVIFFPQLVSPFPPLAAFLTFLFPVLNPQETPPCLTAPHPRPWKDRRQHYAARKKRLNSDLFSSSTTLLTLIRLFIYKTFPASAVVCVDRLSHLKSYSCSCLFTGSGCVGEIVLDQESPQLVHLLFFLFSCTLSVILIAPPKISNSEVLICLECLSLNSCFSLLRKSSLEQDVFKPVWGVSEYPNLIVIVNVCQLDWCGGAGRLWFEAWVNFFCCKYSHCGGFQAINQTSLNGVLQGYLQLARRAIALNPWDLKLHHIPQLSS